ncbi:MAG: tetratricopeptide repeat protein [Prevotella sp.]|nr:tetratricopeptide repeat protein [Prevotella sp.]
MAKKNQMESIEKNDALTKSEAFFVENKKAILIAVVALLVIIAGFFLYKTFVSTPRENKASTELGKGQELFNMEQFEKALNGDSITYAGFVKIASDYSGTKAGNLANLYAGLCYANLNKWAEAQKYLDAYSPADDALVSPAAVAALGNAYAHNKDFDKAVSSLKKAASMADKEAAEGINNSISPVFLLQAAQLLENQGKKEEALNLYKDIKSKYVNAPVVINSEIDKYIERISQ